MKKNTASVTLRNFRYLPMTASPLAEDITEWFSDSDIYLVDIVNERGPTITL